MLKGLICKQRTDKEVILEVGFDTFKKVIFRHNDLSYVNDILWEIISKPLSEVSDNVDITQEELDKVKVVTIKQLFTLIDENEVRHEPVEIIEYSAVVKD